MNLLSLALFGVGALSFVLPKSVEPVSFIVHENTKPVYGSFIVSLHDGHTIEDHWQNIVKDLSKTAVRFKKLWATNSYNIRIDPEIIHELVRYDPGVKHVTQDFSHRLIHPKDTNGSIIMDRSSDTKEESLKRRGDYPFGEYYNNLVDSHGLMVIAEDLSADASKKIISSEGKVDVNNNLELGYEWNEGSKGVDVYLMDSGVWKEHAVFGPGSQLNSATVRDFSDSYVDGETPFVDLEGHGTWTAGILAQRLTSVVTDLSIFNVKIANRHAEITSQARLLEAFDDILEEHITNRRYPPAGWRGSVIAMPWYLDEDSISNNLRAMIYLLYVYGIPMTTSAGNRNKDATVERPCADGYVMCAGGIDNSYAKWQSPTESQVGSNFGGSVEILAPAQDISCAALGGQYNSEVASGTSAPTMFVAEVMAVMVTAEALDGNADDTSVVYARILQNALTGLSTGWPASPVTPNRILNSGVLTRGQVAGIPHRILGLGDGGSAADNKAVKDIASGNDDQSKGNEGQKSSKTAATTTSTVSSEPKSGSGGSNGSGSSATDSEPVFTVTSYAGATTTTLSYSTTYTAVNVNSSTFSDYPASQAAATITGSWTPPRCTVTDAAVCAAYTSAWSAALAGDSTEPKVLDITAATTQTQETKTGSKKTATASVSSETKAGSEKTATASNSTNTTTKSAT